ncbi:MULTISPECIES: acyltransferase [unclassified Lysobacter]|uniref:LpxL/LpxP family acyltransferase n=1 Tax=unclassified Lysobacter TaxID=2635362 RepID=UPI001BE875B2|nr:MULTISPECIES: acyltransferase [unclassified Lysobacter]MBT2749362.1 acyltransferase [Lysobacter sp. ISL-42]MBT2778410.1 acyltransferase [Lysobacter sp. ISL-54]MBT2783846.1 acyltransferase [Lysobacter sp. ISL-52]
MTSSHWKQRPEGGSRFAFHLIRFIASKGGRAVARLTLFPIVAYFVTVRGPERRASRAYLARVLDRAPGLFDVARHIHTFAATILDRVYMLRGGMDRFEVKISGLEPIDRQIGRGQGMLLFGSHLGSFEALRVLARQRPDVKVRVVLDRGHNPHLTQLLDALDPEIARNVIDAGQDGPSIVFAIKQATDEGAIVALLVDRAAPGEPSTMASFLGAGAPFPTAPWLIAAALKLPVVLAFGLYRGGPRYDLVFESFSDGVAIERHNRPAILSALVQRYAERLQHHARSAPYNWFNFYDFWHADDAQQALPDAGADVRRRVAARRSGY